MTAADYNKAVDFPNISAASESRGRSLARAEIAALLATCYTSSPVDIRDAAIFILLLGTGLRRSKLFNLELKGLNLSTGEILVRKGKRGKSRRVCLLTEARPFALK